MDTKIKHFVRRNGWRITQTERGEIYPRGQVQIIGLQAQEGKAVLTWNSLTDRVHFFADLELDDEGRLVGDAGDYHVCLWLEEAPTGERVLRGEVIKTSTRHRGMADPDLTGTWGAEANGEKPPEEWVPQEEQEELATAVAAS